MSDTPTTEPTPTLSLYAKVTGYIKENLSSTNSVSPLEYEIGIYGQTNADTAEEFYAQVGENGFPDPETGDVIEWIGPSKDLDTLFDALKELFYIPDELASTQQEEATVPVVAITPMVPKIATVEPTYNWSGYAKNNKEYKGWKSSKRFTTGEVVLARLETSMDSHTMTLDTLQAFIDKARELGGNEEVKVEFRMDESTKEWPHLKINALKYVVTEEESSSRNSHKDHWKNHKYTM